MKITEASGQLLITFIRVKTKSKFIVTINFIQQRLVYLISFCTFYKFPLVLCVLMSEPDLKKRIRVHLLNAHGLDEAGIDGGGIFREFLNELLKSGFNPNQGFFKTTNEGLLYPNPAAEMLIGESFTRHYYFLGRILGKVSL